MNLNTKPQAKLQGSTTNIGELLKALHNEVLGTTQNVVDLLTRILEFRDVGSGDHVKRTRDLTEILILEMLQSSSFANELIEQDYLTIIRVSPLHDIGKIAVSDAILLKEGKLTDEEMRIVRNHTIIGGQIIDSMKGLLEDRYFKHCRNVCLYHHERFDGKGYPYKLCGTEIPLSARILAIVDVYDALINIRPYKKAMSHREAMTIIADGMGTNFDPDITEIFLAIESKLQAVADL